MSEFMPIPSFYFRVELDNENISFQEVSGLETSIEVEEVIEGGNNLHKLRLPLRQSYGNITLAKGIMSEGDEFYEWVSEALLKKGAISAKFGDRLKTVKVDLMSPAEEIVRSWQIVNAYPIKWSASPLHAAEHKIAIETVELAFEYIESVE